MNPKELGSLHSVEGNEVYMSIDNDRLMERQGGAKAGIAESYILFFAAVEDLPPRKAPGSALNIDGREYTVDDWSETMGVAQVILSQPRSI